MTLLSNQDILIEAPSNENLESIFQEDRKQNSKHRSESSFSGYRTYWGNYMGDSNLSILIQYGRKQLSNEAKTTYLKIASFRKLEQNWDSYGANPITEMVIQNALMILRFLDYRSIAVYHTVPVSNGSIGMEIVGGKKSVELEITKDNTIDYACFEGDEVKDENEIKMIRKDEISTTYPFNSPLQKIVRWLD